MGHYSSTFEGSNTFKKIKMKFCLVLAAALAAVAAEPFYGGIGYGYDYVSPHPTGVSFIRQSRLDGLGYRGKRDAEADAYGYGGYGYGRGVAGHYGGGSSYVGPTVWGLGRKKRDADAWFGYGGYGGNGFAYNAGSGNSFVARSGLGYYPGGSLSRGKRSAGRWGLLPTWGYGYNALSGNSFIRRS